ncbi:hypothetical protein HYH03_016923 [Edaphochlamys debaryana]|uniref:TIGR01458 family HAD-type hydrolase n=1 Tax=Edaphochlamys debaryana TaxID=47281 RepID=A0A835XQH1_9CHLO|nr:hypothetical protein HYH03_016923 [Edaphochlamys debaryana]|eukprot:KAG2484279.1 hypothetical protein HYH03_016923 [Edaphochlamys debaryana]
MPGCLSSGWRSCRGRAHTQRLSETARPCRPRCRRAVLAPTAAAPKGVLCDLDGCTFQSGSDTAIPGAAETFAYFRERGIPWLFVTNTGTRTREGLAAKLQSMGLPATGDDIVTPAKLAGDWLRANHPGPVALFVAPDLLPEFQGLPLLDPAAQSGAGAVVVGDMGLDWTYESLNRAFRLIMDGVQREEAELEDAEANGGPLPPPPMPFISLGKNRYYRDRDGLGLDIGPFTKALEFATDKQAMVLGKPAPLIFTLAAAILGLKPHEVVMVGDDVRGDVGGAQSAGLRGVLVQTGKYRPSDLRKGVTPDGILRSLADLPAWWEAQQGAEAEERRRSEREMAALAAQLEVLGASPDCATLHSVDAATLAEVRRQLGPGGGAVRVGA